MTNILADIRRHSYSRPNVEEYVAMTPILSTGRKSVVTDRQMPSVRLKKHDATNGTDMVVTKGKTRIQLPQIAKRSISTVSKNQNPEGQKRLSPRKKAALMAKEAKTTSEGHRNLDLQIQQARKQINRIIERKKLGNILVENDEQQTKRHRYGASSASKPPSDPSTNRLLPISLNWLQNNISEISVVETEPADPEQLRQFLD